jgi:thymidine phosphorylase
MPTEARYSSNCANASVSWPWTTEMLQQIGRAVGADFDGAEALRALEEATRPETISDQIDRAEESAESTDPESPKGS